MAPEREVSDKEINAVAKWVTKKGGFPRSQYEAGVTILNVDNEPLVVFPKVRVVFGKITERQVLFASDKHAKELEEAGIVNFSEAETTS